MPQAANVLFPAFDVPDAAKPAIVLGFPVALVLGWLFDAGRGEISRTPPLSAGLGSRIMLAIVAK